MNIHIQSLKVWLKSALPWLKYRIFSRGLFFIGAPCTCEQLAQGRLLTAKRPGVELTAT